MIRANQCLNMMSVLMAVAAFYAVMLDLCEDRSSCTVRASPETFTQDPCVGTPKYLDVHFKCRPDEFVQLTACEGESLDISCGRGNLIAVYSAMFGRTPNGTDQCPTNDQALIECQAPGTLSSVSDICQGKKTCTVPANQTVFGDPCPSGINKYLTVSYTCVPRKILKQLHHRTNKKKKKRKKKKKKGSSGDLKVFDEVANITTSTNMSEYSPLTPPGDRFPQSSSDVYETFEQQSVTQMLPVTEFTFGEIKQQHSVNEFTNESTDVTTVQDEAIITTSDDVTINVLDLPDEPHTHHSKDGHKTETISENTGSGESHYEEIAEVTKPAVSILSHNISGDNQLAKYNLENGDTKDSSNLTFSSSDGEYASVKKTHHKASSNQIHTINNQSDISVSDKDFNQVIDHTPSVHSTSDPLILSTTTNHDSDIDADNQESRLQPDFDHAASPNKVPESHYVTERNLTVLCLNYTRPEVRWVGLVRPNDEYTVGFLRDWFSAIHFLQIHQEKAWLYFTLGICFGVIVMLVVVLVKVCFNFHRNIRARLDVSEPTHRSAHTNNHSSLDAPMLEHSDSVDRIEVVRFSPRNTLRSQRSNSHHRDLVNYYG